MKASQGVFVLEALLQFALLAFNSFRGENRQHRSQHPYLKDSRKTMKAIAWHVSTAGAHHVTAMCSWCTLHYMPESEVHVPESVTSIEAGAFYGCRNLNHLKIPDSAASSRKRAVESCDCQEKCVLPRKTHRFWTEVLCN